jgi:hypothetical protein
MWINFQATKPFAVKVYVGGVNAVSREAKIITKEMKKRRKKVCFSISLNYFTFRAWLMLTTGFLAAGTGQIHSGLCCPACSTLA